MSMAFLFIFFMVSQTTPARSGASPTLAKSSAISLKTTRRCASPPILRGCYGSRRFVETGYEDVKQARRMPRGRPRIGHLYFFGGHRAWLLSIDVGEPVLQCEGRA